MVEKIKGIILAGGLGTRLLPMTKITNKHLLPIYDKPMIYYPINTLKSLGIDNIMIITGPESCGHFVELLSDGSEFNVNLTYKVQKGPTGIAGALSLAEEFVGDERCAVILGDNIFQKPIEKLKKFKDNETLVFIKKVSDPGRFGVAEIKNGKIIDIIEKPKKPKSDYIVAGLYIYPSNVFDMIRKIKPSKRGELEITDVDNIYAKKGLLKFQKIIGGWSDAGTVNSLLQASEMIKNENTI